MNRTAALLQEALLLNEEDRLGLVESLLESLQLPLAGDIRAAWTAEAERRLGEVARGEVHTLPAGVVFERMQRKYGA
ncbi:MAG: addiction module protein [Candidatus Delongbacteria bacterium]